MEAMQLSMAQKFEQERMSRAIDATTDPEALRKLAKQLLQAWQSQKAATRWVMRNPLNAPSHLVAELADTMGMAPWDDPLA